MARWILLTALTVLFSATALADTEVRENQIRMSVLPGARAIADPANPDISVTTVVAALTFVGAESVENCWIDDFSTTYLYNGSSVFTDFAVGVDHIEIEPNGTIAGTPDERLAFTPGQTRYFYLTVLAADTSSGGCGEPCRPRFVLRCVNPANPDRRDFDIIMPTRDLLLESFEFNTGADRPDIIPILATTSEDGTLRIAQAGGTNVAAVAAVNIGAPADIDIGVVIDGGANAAICETGSDGICLAPRQETLRLHMATGTPHLFSVRVEDAADFSLPNSPANNRLFVYFLADHPIADDRTSLVGVTSVAYNEPPATTLWTDYRGVWRLLDCTSDPRRPLYLNRTLSDLLIVSDDGLASYLRRSNLGGRSCARGDAAFTYRFPESLQSDEFVAEGVLANAPNPPARPRGSYASVQVTPSADSSRIDSVHFNASPFFSSGAVDPDYDIPVTRDDSFTGNRIPAGEYEVELPPRYPYSETVRLLVDDEGRMTTRSSTHCNFTGSLRPVLLPSGELTGVFRASITAGCEYPYQYYSLSPLNGVVLAYQRPDGRFAWTGSVFARHVNGATVTDVELVFDGIALTD